MIKYLAGLFYWGLLLLTCAAVSGVESTHSNNAGITLVAPPYSEFPIARWQQLTAAYQNKQALFGDTLLNPHPHQPAQGSIYLNELILQDSPYLIRHATNPVNWLPWSAAVFAQAKAQNKPILLSIGYSTCHWCHVMEQDSFVKNDVAEVINRHFIAVKVDRELHPAVDELYISALNLVTGRSGWPITAVLNDQGAPLFIDSFVAHDPLIVLLTRLADKWHSQRTYLEQNGATVMRLLAQSQSVSPGLQWQAATMTKTVEKLLQQLDPVNGGFAGAPKFPTEGMILFLLDQLGREDNPALAKLVELQLDQMIAKGLVDALHGGFHRYATDGQWQLPHFEKMLYNQGQLLLVYSRAYKIFAKPRYLAVIKDTVRFIRQWLYQPGAGLYSAIDADYQGEEGQYYTWTAAELASIPKQQAQTAGLQTFASAQDERRGIYFTAPQSAAAAAVRVKLSALRGAQEKPYIDKKIITAWNALTIWGLVEAYAASREESTKTLALTLAQTLWSQHFLTPQAGQKPRLMRASFHGERSSDGGTLDDYAYFAQAMIALFDISGDQQWLTRAQLLANIVLNRFLADDQGFYLSDQSHDAALGVKLKQSKDGELLAGGAIMTGVLQDLWLRTGDRQFKQQAKQSTDYLKAQFQVSPLQHLTAGLVISNANGKINDALQYFAAGRGLIRLSHQDPQQRACAGAGPLKFAVKLQAGWHLNSATPLQPHLRPTRVRFEPGRKASGEPAYRIRYPGGKVMRLGFQQAPLSIYEGEFVLDLDLADHQDARSRHHPGVRMSVDLQACSDKVCLLPEKRRFYLPSCLGPKITNEG